MLGALIGSNKRAYQPQRTESAGNTGDFDLSVCCRDVVGAADYLYFFQGKIEMISGQLYK